MKKKSFIVLLSAILVLVSASTGVCFADSPAPVQLPLLTANNYATVTSQGYQLNSGSYWTLYAGVSAGYSEPLYVGCYPDPDVSNFLVYICASFSANQYVSYTRSWDATNTQPVSQVDSSSGLYFQTLTSNPNQPTSNCPLYDSQQAFFDAVMQSLGSVDTYHFSLPYGNALLISSNSDFTINRRSYNISNTTYNYQKYVRASDNFSYRVNGSYQGVVENSNVVGTFGVNVFGSNDVMSLLIPWQPVNQNVLGRATSYNYYNASLNPSDEISVLVGQSFMIWYPYYANNQDTSKINETNMEVAIDIFHSAPITFTTFPITGSTASSGEDAYIQNTASVSAGGSSSQSDGGDGTINVTFDNAPTAGGNHGQAPINDNNSILGVLSNLQNTLLGLFNKAIDGIHNLISLGSDFLQSVQIMFSWLPAELLVIITSGFIILLTIGVLKTLWR